jgi:dTDP-4-dehydrorhamnose reductase
MRVLLTGACGQLAGALAAEFGVGHDVVALGHAELDVACDQAVSACVAGVRPDLILNAAAYNRVDEAEDRAAEAIEVNALAVRSLVRAAGATGAALVHYSSDFVFDGRTDRPYTEEDTPSPASVYAASKLLGEWFAREAPRAYVLRVESLFGGTAARSSVDRIVEAVLDGREARVFADRTISPSYVVDVAHATRLLVERDATPGLYHCVNTGSVTWLELARAVAAGLGRDARLIPVSVADVPLRAARPVFSALSNQKLAAAGVVMPDWRDAIVRYLRTRVAAGQR